jgi:hypothetical protein
VSVTLKNTLTLEHHASVPEMLFISLLPSPTTTRGLAEVRLLLTYVVTGVEFAVVSGALRGGVTVSQLTTRDSRDKERTLNSSENCFLSACVC